MASKTVIDAVRARLVAEFSGLPVYFPNETVKPPAALAPFAVVEFPIGRGQQITFKVPDAADTMFREEGVIRFVLSVKLAAGVDTLLTKADELAALFRVQKFDGVETYTPGPPNTLGADGGYYAVSLAIPYTFDFMA